MAEFIVKGIVEMQGNMKGASKDYMARLAEALYEESLLLLEIAKTRVPVRYGYLRDSGKVFRPIIIDGIVTVQITFGDETVQYAMIVHERLDVRHISGQAKYLESVMLDNADMISAKIAARMNR